MQRIRKCGLCLIALLAVSAMAATAASAAEYELKGPPEWGHCVATTPKTGEYAGKNCLFPAKGKGSYNFVPEPGTNPAFSGIGENIVLETPAKTRISCAASAFEGNYTGPKTATLTLTLIGCVLNGTTTACQTSPAKTGEIEASLEAEIGLIRKVKPIVGLDLKPKSPSTTVATFQCGAPPAIGPSGTVEGSVIGVITPKDHATPEFKVRYAEAAGKQAVEHFEGGPNDTLTVKLLSGLEAKTEPIGFNSLMFIENAEPLEIKAK